jgi:hypothetical protein
MTKNVFVKINDSALKFLREFNPLLFVRPTIEAVKKQGGKELVGVEIGVSSGLNSRTILMKLPMKKLYCVDPWSQYVQDNQVLKKDQFFEKAKKRLKPWKDKVVFIREYSTDAVNQVPDNLDFVYIDGNHDYEPVKKDIELYFPKVKSGGIIGGHDFDGYYPGVCQAVLEFAAKEGLKLRSFNNDWWVVKNG